MGGQSACEWSKYMRVVKVHADGQSIRGWPGDVPLPPKTRPKLNVLQVHTGHDSTSRSKNICGAVKVHVVVHSACG